MGKIVIFTDGACSGNPGPGGWGVVICLKDKVKILSGGKKLTTNNEMELTAIVEALKAIKKYLSRKKMFEGTFEINTDSSYCFNAFTMGWLLNWKMKGWTTAKGEQVKNLDLWKEALSLYLELRTLHDVQFKKVKGHSGVYLNEEADRIAREVIGKEE